MREAAAAELEVVYRAVEPALGYGDLERHRVGRHPQEEPNQYLPGLQAPPSVVSSPLKRKIAVPPYPWALRWRREYMSTLNQGPRAKARRNEATEKCPFPDGAI